MEARQQVEVARPGRDETLPGASSAHRFHGEPDFSSTCTGQPVPASGDRPGVRTSTVLEKESI